MLAKALKEEGGRGNTARRRNRIVFGLLAAVLLASAGIAAGYSAWIRERPVRAGDTVEIHVQIFDTAGRLLYSTRQADLETLEATSAAWPDGLFRVPTLEADTPMKWIVEADPRPIPLDGNTALLMGTQFIGQKSGFKTIVPVTGTFTGYNETLTLERARGPFQREFAISNERLEHTPHWKKGEALVFDEVLHARLVEQGDVNSRIEITEPIGARLPVKRAGFEAEVTAAADPGQFGLYLHTTLGHSFALQRSCKFAQFDLKSGTYRVSALDDRSLTLERSPTKWPQLIEREVVMVIELGKNLGQISYDTPDANQETEK